MEDAFRLYTYFQEDPTRFVLFFVCCVLVCIAAVILKKRGDTVFTQVRNKLVLPSLLLAVLLFNPFSASILVSKMTASRVFRFSWVVPLLVVVAITMVAVVRKLPFKPVKVLAAVLAPLLFVGVNFQLSSFLDEYWTNDTPNWYKIPECVIDLCDYIENDDTFEEKSVVMPSLLSAWVRQYDGNIVMPFSANHYVYNIHDNIDFYPLYCAVALSDIYDLSQIGQLASEYPFNYIVIPAYAATSGSLKSSGYELVYTVNDEYLSRENEDYTRLGVYHMEYDLYRRKEAP